MQDDITAGAEHLIRQGLADRARICIVGASYGAYAPLWGLVGTPALYRCGVSFAGVTEISRMYSDWSDRASDKVARQMMKFRIRCRLSHARRQDQRARIADARRRRPASTDLAWQEDAGRARAI
ncbi:alpha/beta hydrolase family protein [Massilia sp. ST3]|uniref:alpha/beta hydrolase family protein n=1 Tax=Massilia sp. ST3 TaxID=2824903 RepID=UPI0035A295C3